MKILGSHVRVEVDDLEKAKECLSKMYGMAPLRQLRKPDGSSVVWYPGLEIAQSAQRTQPGTMSHLAWEVDDIEAAMKALKSNGVVFETDEPRQIDPSWLDTRELVQFVFFQSPLGFRGELYQITPAPAHRA
jgi:catechol 2,3-dioxygenase-like lactoylglutathione lyase family enzyme